ncbi:Type 1 glutamine amidotransferase-like domain-containing protein [Gordonia sp. zg691]|uniref:Type 1 glutamine amidotransferase-like domain-containing protein n=1 Tax=Gordonia jinghuaiqii TaxID=2758710 RepID=A0A7D7LSQ3_9ACTN|nr:Type 1 glutamine amidotransferase-like domain-containing protein [Gordonia jinghuaiqii]MBD0861923.1 Type 1 glutamine amidotransferase-like domain-containing protein [Gordonia jinghuaiqii]MCR5977828.1 peptidase S51 [Gordonia jinghuaiqii]QMT02485.1 Type 1 glutamine amidotransferase-like domain-containing protein [Gordonia jinghuaiqii]
MPAPDLLLLSRWLTPVPEFLRTRTGAGGRIGYLPTASSIYPDQAWLDLERATLRDQGFVVCELDPELVSAAAFTRTLGEIDAVFVAGGNVFHLLGALRLAGADRPLVDAVRAGLPYIGVSAGAAITGPDIAPLSLLDNPGEAAPLASTLGLGLVDVIVVPHAEGTVGGRGPVDATRERFAAEHPLHFLRDDEALVVSGETRTVISG